MVDKPEHFGRAAFDLNTNTFLLTLNKSTDVTRVARMAVQKQGCMAGCEATASH